jgi:hypothetical protein
MLFWVRGRDKTFDPDFKETYSFYEAIYEI